MPTGVGTHFLQVLASDARFAQRRLLVGLIAATLLVVPAFWMAELTGVAFHVAGMILGFFGAFLVARMVTKRLEASLRSSWSEWMRLSVGCESLSDIHRRMTGRSLRNHAYWTAAVLVLLWAVEVGLLVLAFQADADPLWTLPVLLANAAALAAIAGYHLHRGPWTRQLQTSVTDLVESGEIGVWGVL